MAQKYVLEPLNIITNGSMATDLTSNTITCKYLDNISIQINFTGSPNGSFAVDVSNDNVNFINLNLSPAVTTSSSPIGIDINQTGFAYLRVRYVRSSGTGTLNVIVTGKSI